MEVSPEIKDALKAVGVSQEDGVSFLLLLYNDLKPSFLPYDHFFAKMQIAGIIGFDETSETIDWRLPLFEEQSTAFGWVKEWVQLFADVNSTRRGVVSTSTARMKKFFRENPSVRQHEIMEATKMYLRQTQAAYIQTSHYFITKGNGADKTSGLLEWLEKYKLSEEMAEGRTGITNRLQ